MEEIIMEVEVLNCRESMTKCMKVEMECTLRHSRQTDKWKNTG